MYFLSQKIVFFLANSADPDRMPHTVAFHLGLHCLPKYLFLTSGLKRDQLCSSSDITSKIPLIICGSAMMTFLVMLSIVFSCLSAFCCLKSRALRL